MTSFAPLLVTFIANGSDNWLNRGSFLLVVERSCIPFDFCHLTGQMPSQVLSTNSRRSLSRTVKAFTTEVISVLNDNSYYIRSNPRTMGVTGLWQRIRQRELELA